MLSKVRRKYLFLLLGNLQIIFSVIFVINDYFLKCLIITSDQKNTNFLIFISAKTLIQIWSAKLSRGGRSDLTTALKD